VFRCSWLFSRRNGFDEILADFPYLEKEDIIAALEYAQNKVNHSIITVQLDAAK
jgi:uncharacterized protein (DUF433 family)